MSDDRTLEEFQELLMTVPLQRRMGIRIVQRDPTAIVTMELTEEVRGPVAPLHGGILAALSDITCAIALAGAYDPSQEIPVTTDMHIRYLGQPNSGPVKAEGQVVHRGKTLLSVECSVVDAESRQLARATGTYMIRVRRTE